MNTFEFNGTFLPMILDYTVFVYTCIGCQLDGIWVRLIYTMQDIATDDVEIVFCPF